VTDRTAPLYVSRLVGVAAVVLLVVLALLLTIQIPTLGAGHIVLDFDAFYIAGQMGREGNMADAYDKMVMLGRQSELAGATIWMPWTYPPQFDLIAIALTSLPRGLSYALFMLATFVPYLLILRRIARQHLSDVLFLGLPAFLITTAVGQNGFLTGALMGLFVLGWQQNRSWAGIPLGLMVIKPHLALGAGMLALASGRWAVVMWSFGTIAATSALATLVFGPGIWQAFLDGTATASEGMKLGYYPMYRMTSVYAFLATLHVAAGVALAAQVVMALVSLAVIVRISRLDWPAARVLGVTLIASMGVSPYNYDYDIPILVLGLALLLPDLACRLGQWGRVGLFTFSWLCGGWGQFAALTLNAKIPDAKGVDVAVSLGACGQIALLLLIWSTFRRQPAPVASARAAV
jgi:hypothetical protein